MNVKKIFCVLLLIVSAVYTLSAQTVYVNFAEALQKSIYFYDAEKCGFSGTNRLEWRGPCHLEDGAIALTTSTTNLTQEFIDANRGILDPDGDGYVDLIGGFHDAGDHVQFGLPQGYSASTLGWGLYEFKQAYIDTGNYEHMLEILKHFTDFFIRCTFKDASGNVIAFCYQTGDGSVDHAYWGPPELQDPAGLNLIGQSGISYPRPGWFAYPAIPGSDVCGEAAAALVAMYFNYQSIDSAYAATCLNTAKALYTFAKANRGCADSGGYYGSAYDYDELSWAAVWLYEATGLTSYIDDIMAQDASGNYTGYMNRLIGTVGDTWVNIWVHCWDVVWGGMFVKLAADFPDNTAYNYWARWNLEFWSGGTVPHEDINDGTYLGLTPAGYGMINTWGSARYNTAAQLCALVYAKHSGRTDFANWAKGQMTYIMGANPMNRSYIVGYGATADGLITSAAHPHHRAAHGSFTNSMDDPADHRHTLWGALVGGPDGSDIHVDSTKDYVYNEVACDYNAGFVGSCAGLYEFYGRAAGHQSVANFPPAETTVDQISLTAKLEQENLERTQVTVKLYGLPMHLPAAITGLSCRYFFDISELVAAGQTIADVYSEVYYDEHATRYGGVATISQPILWNGTVYYIEIAWGVPGVIGTREFQFGLIAKQGPDWAPHWDPANDYSRTGLAASYIDTQYIPVYRDGVLMYGVEPGTDGTPAPTTPPSDTTAPTTVPATDAPTQAPVITADPTAAPNETLAPTDIPTATPAPTDTPAPTGIPTATPAGVTADPTTPPTITADPTTPPAVTADPTSPPSVTADPTAVSTTPPVETTAPTTPPTGTTVPATGCTCTNLCTSQTSITVPFSYDGAGEFCWVSSSLGSYANSWNTDSVNINGTNCTNLYTAASSISAINGLYYIYYKASVSWSHFEIK